jgi:hypothetical protein
MKVRDGTVHVGKSGERAPKLRAAGGVVKYDYPLTFYATSAMSIRLRANIL